MRVTEVQYRLQVYQWRTHEFFSGREWGVSTNSVEDRENRDMGVVAH